MIITQKMSDKNIQSKTLPWQEFENLVGAVEDGLSTVLADILFSLNLNEEPVQEINGHDVIFRILLK